MAPEIFTFLAGRILQGVGGGWVVGLCSVAIGLLFANRLLPRVYSAISSVWGIAVLVGPMLGGLFADAGSWRAVFWLFAVQGAAVAAAAWAMLPAAETTDAQHAVAWRQLGLIALGVTLIALADLAGDFARTAGLTALGVMVFLLALRLDGRSEVRLLPRGSGDLSTAHGAGFATMFLLNAATMGLPVYGPAILQTLQGLSALLAGYVVGAEALLWTAAALPVSGLTGRWPGRLIRFGSAMILAGLALCALVFNGTQLIWVVFASGLIGAGFGFSWAFISQRILGDLDGDERAIGGAGIATVRMTGAAAGSAMAAAVANLSGFAHGFSAQAAARPASGCSPPRFRWQRSPVRRPGVSVRHDWWSQRAFSVDTARPRPARSAKHDRGRDQCVQRTRRCVPFLASLPERFPSWYFTRAPGRSSTSPA